jgi:hypothetical protein
MQWFSPLYIKNQSYVNNDVRIEGNQQKGWDISAIADIVGKPYVLYLELVSNYSRKFFGFITNDEASALLQVNPNSFLFRFSSEPGYVDIIMKY